MHMKALLALLALFSIASGHNCDSLACCEAYQVPNQFTGQGYLEYAPECLDNAGSYCLTDITGCRLCSNPLEVADINNNQLPICDRFVGDLDIEDGSGLDGDCETDACCAHISNPNPLTGAGYLQYNPDCNDNIGVLCIGFTSCSLCSNPYTLRDNDVAEYPACYRFGGPPVIIITSTGTTTTNVPVETGTPPCDATVSSNPILSVNNTGDQFGASTLIRSPETLTSFENYVSVSDAYLGDAYTLWVVWFNDPSECLTSPCTVDDLDRDVTNAGWGYGGGGMITNTTFLGRASFTLDQPGGFSGNSIADIDMVEVHVFLRSQGEPFSNATMFWEQISSIDGPCNPSCEFIYYSTDL